jgi:hypothetical protein
MEVDDMFEMFERSEDLQDVKYRYYTRDGDIKTFKVLLDKRRYGKKFFLKKKKKKKKKTERTKEGKIEK